MGKFVKVASTSEIPEGRMKSFDVEYNQILIAHTKDGFYAVSDVCSHDSSPISMGNLFDNEVMCPRHHARFDIKTGAVKAPPAIVPIDTYELKIEDDTIYVQLED